MTIYASKHFITKLRCSITVSKQQPTEAGPFDGWSADLLKVSKVQPVVVLMHDGSLGTVIVPLRGIQNFQEFVPPFLKKVNQLLGTSIKVDRQNVLVLRRTNRPLIGTLHDAKKLLEADIIEQMESGRPIDWDRAANYINQTPFSVIEDKSPSQALAELISEIAENNAPRLRR